MLNKALENVVDGENKKGLKRLVVHFNRLVSNRDYEVARDYFKAQPEDVKRAIRYDSDSWYRVLTCLKL